MIKQFILALLPLCVLVNARIAFADQSVALNGQVGGKRFDGVGAVSGGGATSVLLKDYPEPQRSEILDLLFKPKFGASMPALFVEVPGDGNSTQGTEPSHMHTRSDQNYFRGYEWWLMSEAKKRNPDITLDACAWSAPGWVGNGQFWSQDMADYYVNWIQGLKREHGLDLVAIGCRNEKGVNIDFAKRLRTSLNAASLQNVLVHGFDNWGATKFDFVPTLDRDPAFRDALGVISAHTMTEVPASETAKQAAEKYHKPLWNTEEHIYKQGFDCEISLVQSFNENYISNRQTKIINWYLAAGLYPMEPYSETPAALMANSPWSGHFHPREVLWGYAHYGQFVKVGWQYLDGACLMLAGGGSIVTMKAPDKSKDYSIIIETKGAKAPQTVTFKLAGGLSEGKLCVWRSTAAEQFVRQSDIAPVGGAFSITLEPAAIYSLSTTTGQQKGSPAAVPAAKAFPFPYYENFESYGKAQPWGYLPHYFADIVGVFELVNRPDGLGQCLRQVIAQKAQSWAPEWMPYTIIGDDKWADYEVSVDVFFDNGGSAGIMGRVNNVGSGYGTNPKAYCLRLQEDGSWSLLAPNQQARNPIGAQLATGKVEAFDAQKWHNVKLQFVGATITALIDNATVALVTNTTHRAGMVGLFTGGNINDRNSALFDNLIIKPVGGAMPVPSSFPASLKPLYGGRNTPSSTVDSASASEGAPHTAATATAAPTVTRPANRAASRAGMPAGFPEDLPLMPNLVLAATPESDITRGTGRVTFSGSVTRDAAVAFYDQSMKEQDWSEDESRADGSRWLMSFTKGKLKASLTLAGSGDSCTVTILWETQQ